MAYSWQIVEMDISDKFCLKWEGYQSNVNGAFKELWSERELCDVTLVTEDDEEIEAHKVILSACSSRLRNMLKRHKHPHPLIYLQGSNMKEISLLLNFMYEGEVKVAQTDLDQFLQTAANLKVKGLVEDNIRDQKVDDKPVDENKVKHEYSEVYADNENALNNSQPSGNFLQPYEEIPSRDSTQNEPLKPAKDDSFENGHLYSTIIEKGDFLMQFENGVWKCNVCGKTDRKKFNIATHTEIHITGAAYNCTYCGKTFKTKNSLRVHRYKTHTSDKFIEQLGHVV